MTDDNATLRDVLPDRNFLQVHPDLIGSLGGDAAGAVILSFVRYRLQSSAAVDHDGVEWIRLTWEDVEQGTRITPKIIRARLDTLSEAGLLVRVQGLTDTRDRAYWYRVNYDAPVQSIRPSRPDNHRRSRADGEPPSRADVHYLSEELEKQNTKTTQPTETSVDDTCGFDAFWSSYPKRNGQRVGKANALRLWRKLKQSDRDAAVAKLPLYARAAGEFPKDPERYLRHRLWEDLEERHPGGAIQDNAARLAERARRFDR